MYKFICLLCLIADKRKIGEVSMKKAYWKKLTCVIMCIVMVSVNGLWQGEKLGAQAATKEDIRLNGIDVSYHQGTINWSKVKADGIDYAILRCGFGQDLVNQDDLMWEENADACTKLGIPFGVYLYSYATTEEKAIGEAKHVLRLIEDYDLQYPVYYDIEDSSQKSLTKAKLGKIAQAFADVIEEAGYEVGIYSSYSMFNDYLTDAVFDNYPRWVARYNTYCGYSKSYHMWQYSSKGSVNGISGNVDMDYLIGTDVACEVSDIELEEKTCTLKVGESVQLNAQVLPKNAFEKNIVWTTDADTVVSVKDGVVTALAEGTATVRATSKEDNQIFDTCKITVSKADQPQVTTSPAITQTPTATSGPSVDDGTSTIAPTTPTITMTPTTQTPEITTGSSITPIPTLTETIAVTEIPTEEPTPTATIMPTETAKPAVTQTPKPTATVKVTQTPVPTATPVVSVGKVKNFTYQAVTKEKIKLSWKKVSGVTGYRIYYYNTVQKKYVTLKSISASKQSLEVTKVDGKKLKAGTKYQFRIAAYKTVDGKKIFGNSTNLSTITKPDTVKVKSVSRISATKAVIKWNTTNSAQGYIIYLSTSPKSGYKMIATLNNKAKKSYTISGLKKGKVYYIRLCAYKKLDGKAWYGNYGVTRKINKK